MAATPKHKRSSSKRRMSRSSERYSKVLTRAKKIKKFGGSFLTKVDGKLVPSHRVSAENPIYKNNKVVRSKTK